MHILGIFWANLGHILSISWAYLGHILGISWAYPGHMWTYLGHISGISWEKFGKVPLPFISSKTTPFTLSWRGKVKWSEVNVIILLYKKNICKKKYFRWMELDPKFGIWAFSAIFALFLEWQKIKFKLAIPSMSIVIWNRHAKSFPMLPWYQNII